MSASAKTMLALLPPSSSVTFAKRAAARRADGAAGLDPAGEGDLGDVGMVDQRLAGGAVAGHDVEHAGRDADLLGEPRRPRCIDAEVTSDGLTTTVLPAASAGATAIIVRKSGEFQGMITPTTPSGSRSV